MEWKVSPVLTVCLATEAAWGVFLVALPASSRRSIWASLVAGGFSVAVSVFEPEADDPDLDFDFDFDVATSVSAALGLMGRCRAMMRRPLRLEPRRPFQRRSICGETPKFSATVSTVSPR